MFSSLVQLASLFVWLTPQDKGGTSERFRLVVPLGIPVWTSTLEKTCLEGTEEAGLVRQPHLNKLTNNPGGWILFHSQTFWTMAVLWQMILPKNPQACCNFAETFGVSNLAFIYLECSSTAIRKYSSMPKWSLCNVYTCWVVGFWSCWSFPGPCVIYKGRRSLWMLLFPLPWSGRIQLSIILVVCPNTFISYESLARVSQE